MMEHDKTAEANDAGSNRSEENIVESAGETTAAATGPAERGAMTGGTSDEGVTNARPVGADTMVKVADAVDPTQERS
jgi:hypothetical protein